MKPSSRPTRKWVPLVSLPLVSLALASLTIALPSSAADLAPLGRQIADFSLRDVYGKSHQLSELADRPIVVLAFLGTECPLAKLYAPRLADLDRRFRDRGVTIWAINSNAQDSVTEIAHYAQRHQLEFPMLKDPGQKVADLMGAERTPEVFILDGERKIRYHGRIDDQYGIGYQRPAAERQFVAEALEELLKGQPVSTSQTESIGCFIGRETVRETHGEITYASHVAEILNTRCVECHRNGQIAPFPLSSYDDLQGWGETILEVIDQQRMPPWSADPAYGSFRNEARMTDAEKALLRSWIEDGMPQGNPDEVPVPPQFAEGWRIESPDQVFYIADEPFSVPAEGVVDYQYFEVDPGFTEDKFIWAAEARPDNPEVVHHIIVYIKAPGQKDLHGGGVVDGYAPGSPPRVLTDGMAIKVPAGSKFIFEMHYTPNGSPAKDRSLVGVKFLDAGKVQKLVYGNLAINQDFVIPPNADEHQVTAEREIRRDLLLLNLTPHMHLRGKSFRYEAIYPDGRQEVLLDVPRYDFNWQLTYELSVPKLLPKGTRILCTAAFDNSEDNLANPAPDKEVRWGEQSWEEMMIGFFDVIPAN